jgi:hypothetical protein
MVFYHTQTHTLTYKHIQGLTNFQTKENVRVKKARCETCIARSEDNNLISPLYLISYYIHAYTYMDVNTTDVDW